MTITIPYIWKLIWNNSSNYVLWRGKIIGSVSSVGRASVLWAEGHGFEPHIEHIVTLHQLINYYLRFDGHSNYYVLTAISQNKAFYLLYMNIALNTSCIRVTLCLFDVKHLRKCTANISITFNDRMQVRSLLQHAKAWVGTYGKLPCFQNHFVWFYFIYANMPELVQGGALKMLCVRTRGFEPHC